MANRSKTREPYCPVDTTAAILKRHGVSAEDALECLVHGLWVDHQQRLDARRDMRRRGTRQLAIEAVPPFSPSPPSPAPPAPPAPIEHALETMRELVAEHGMLEIIGEKNGRPIGIDGEVDHDYQTMSAVCDVLEAAIEDAQRQFKD